MEIIENREAWTTNFVEQWRSVVEETGKAPYKKYQYITNNNVPGLSGINLREKRLILVSTAGAYLKAEQTPFDAPNLLGDYSIRTWPLDTPFDQLAVSHDHYDHAAIMTDFQTCLPTEHLQEMVSAGEIGSLATDVISFSGYMPDAPRFVDETLPMILSKAQNLGAEAALFAPV